MCDRWKDIGTIAHNKSAITVEITSRDDTIIFHMVSVVSAGGLRARAHTHTLTQRKLNKNVQIHSQISLQETNRGACFFLEIQLLCQFKISMFISLCLYVQEDMEMAKYIARLFTARHKFYKQNKICAE